MCLAVAACTWTPEVRPVEPQSVVKGAVYVVDHEAVAGEDYLLVVTDYKERIAEALVRVARDAEERADEAREALEDEADEEAADELRAQAREAEERAAQALAVAADPSALSPNSLRDLLEGLQRDILEAGSGDSCRVPGTPYNYYYKRDDPESRAVDGWRLAYRTLDDGVYHLRFMDQHCVEMGPALATWSYPTAFREVGGLHDQALVRDQSDELWWLDPFTDEKRRVARRVLAWDFAAAVPGAALDDRQRAVILLEGDRPPDDGEDDEDAEPPPLLGELVIRDLRGEELARFGQNVSNDFVQTSYGELRVAWVTDGVLYEAVGPTLEPTRLTPEDGEACEPRYGSGELEFLFPCEQRRVNRIDLSSGQVERLEPGIADEWTGRGWSFELRYEGEPDPGTGRRDVALWAEPPGEGEFQRVEPPIGNPQPIDAERLIGITSVDEGQGDLGTWHVSRGFETILSSAAYYYPLEDNRYTSDQTEPVYLWVVHHGVRDGVGEVSMLSARDLSTTSVAQGVPLGGFRQYTFTAVANPALVMLRDLGPEGGTLEARLLPDLLGTPVDEGVIGFTSRSSHQEPGLYYSVGPGEREGIWFAPL